MADYLNRKFLVKKILSGVINSRMEFQFNSDGSQPLELFTGNSWNNSLMNRQALFNLAELGEKYKIYFWNYKLANGTTLNAALDSAEWKYEQIDKMYLGELYLLLQKAIVKYDSVIYSSWIERIYGSSTPKFYFHYS